MEVRVVKETCIGCGSCVAICDKVFEIGDDGLAQVKADFDFTTIDEELKKDIMDAVDGCPTSAIEVTEE